MFRSKILMPLAQIVGVLILLKALFVLVMFVWAHVGQAPIPFINPAADALQKALILIQELGLDAFLYLFVGVLSSMVQHKGAAKMATARVKSATKKSSARRR